MAYRDEVDRVLTENDEIRRALAKARSDARITAMRQVLLAFAFGLSWSVLGSDANAGEASGSRCMAPPWGHGWVEIRPDDGSTFVIDETIPGRGETRIAMRPGEHRVQFLGPYGEHCAMVLVHDGRTVWAYDGQRGSCR